MIVITIRSLLASPRAASRQLAFPTNPDHAQTRNKLEPVSPVGEKHLQA